MMIERLTIDSSVLVSLLIESESNQDEARRFLKFILSKDIKIAMPINVLFESFHALRRNGIFDNEEKFFEFSNIMNFNCFNYFDLNIDFFNLFNQIEFFNSLKTSDAIIAISAFLNESFLITWDKKLLKNCYHGCTPTEFLETFT